MNRTKKYKNFTKKVLARNVLMQKKQTKKKLYEGIKNENFAMSATD